MGRWHHEPLRQRQSRWSPEDQNALDAAIGALSADELRTFLRAYVADLEEPARTVVADALVERAARGSSGWRPSVPSKKIVGEVERFVEAARQVGQADPSDIDSFLRQADRVYLAGDLETARALYACLLPAIGDADIDLGQHEAVDEVLTVAVGDCAARYLVAVYCTSPLGERARALHGALEEVEQLSYLGEPIAAMERVATVPLPDLSKFVPQWVTLLEGAQTPDGECESAQHYRLREAVERSEGVAGLERLARQTKRPTDLREWCTALMKRAAWAEALAACDEAAMLVTSPHWRGEFLDDAALAAQQLGRGDVTERLDAAWRGAPTPARLLRWLGAGSPGAGLLKKRAAAALKRCPTESPLLCGVLQVIAGDVQGAAEILAAAPGLGWSRDGHPGHALFASLAWLLAGTPDGSLRAAVAAVIQRPPQTSEIMDHAPGDVPTAGNSPQLATPALIQLLGEAKPPVNTETRAVVVRALRAAATARVNGVLHEKRRRYYDHAALLVACCVEIEEAGCSARAGTEWAAALQQRFSRYPAFQAALRDALSRVNA
jgi:hypothetical protein